MKFKLDECVIVKGRKATVYDYNCRHDDYTVAFEDGTREYNVVESDIEKEDHSK